MLRGGWSCDEDDSLAKNSRSVCASGMLLGLNEYSLRAAPLIPETADFRRMTFSLADTGDCSSKDVGGVEGVDALDVFSKEVLGVDTTLRWWRVASVMSSFRSLEVGGLK